MDVNERLAGMEERGERKEHGERRAARWMHATAHEGAQPGGGIIYVCSIGSLTSAAEPQRIELSAACLASLGITNRRDKIYRQV